MAMAEHAFDDLDGDDDLLSLPPELAADQPPLTDDQLDEFATYLAMVADSAGITQEQALELVWEPGDLELPPMPPAVEAFGRVVDEASADWAMAKYGVAVAAKEAAKAKKQAYVERIGRWHDREVKRVDADLAYFGMLLEAFARARRTDKVKSWNLPTGVLSSTAKNVGGKVAVSNEAEVIGWLKSTTGLAVVAEAVATARADIMAGEEPEAILNHLVAVVLDADPYAGAVKVTEKLLVSKLTPFATVKDARAVDAKGEPVPGLAVQPETVAYKITPG